MDVVRPNRIKNRYKESIRKVQLMSVYLLNAQIICEINIDLSEANERTLPALWSAYNKRINDTQRLCIACRNSLVARVTAGCSMKAYMHMYEPING